LNEVTDEMIKQHEKLIETVVKKEINLYMYEKIHKLSKEDVFQIGRIGLFKALQSYDESKNAQFSTHAYINIYGELMHSIRGSYHGTKVRVKIARAIATYSKEVKENKVCDVKALQDKYDLTDEDLMEVVELGNKRFTSGNKQVKNEKRSEEMFGLMVGKQDDNFKRILRDEEWNEMFEVVNSLQRDVLELYLKGFTCVDIAEILGKTSSYIRRVFNLGVQKIREYYTYKEHIA